MRTAHSASPQSPAMMDSPASALLPTSPNEKMTERPRASWRNSANIRNLMAFWIFGMCNNFAYVIMLSAAEDILDQQQHVNHNADADDGVCEKSITARHCATMSTGAVLLADIIPSLIIKATFPFFMQRIPFGFRHFVVVAIQAACYLIVAFSSSVAMSLTGVIFASMCSGLGEITYLSLTSYFSKNTISTWSSGTGGAGVVGSLAYAALTEPMLGNLSPSNALLIMLVVPGIFALAYWVLLVMPPTVYSPGLNPKTWVVPKLKAAESSSSCHRSRTNSLKPAVVDDSSSPPDLNYSSSPAAAAATIPADLSGGFHHTQQHHHQQHEFARSEDGKKSTAVSVVAENDGIYGDKVPQRLLTLGEKLRLILPLLKYMIPLALVYVGEYLINQGIVQLIFFDCDHSFGLTRKSQYRWYQVIYQVGVFISRSSVNVVELPMFVLLALPVLQLLNAVFFFFDSLYFFVPHIGIIFALILVEGLFGGGSYVNTFNRIHREVAPDIREYSLSAASMSDSFGILLSGFAAIPLHNYVCGQPLPQK